MQRAVIFAAGDIVEVDALHLTSPSPGMVERRESPLPDLQPVSEAQPVGQRTNIMRDLEREHILETLASVGGSRKLAGQRLGMSERTLRHKLKQYRDAGLFNE
jgi:two-component system response regulator FlrC